MAMPELVFDNENHFVDITNDDVRIRFADTEEIEGHGFKHVEYGIFAADPAFIISNSDMYDMVAKYRDVVYVVECENESAENQDQIYKVIFAYSKESSNDYHKLNYINHTGKNSSKLKEYYDFNKYLDSVEYDYYRSTNLTPDNLPESKSVLIPIYNRLVLPNGRRPWIKLDKHIGIEVEEGIYYFAKSGDSIGSKLHNLPVVNLNIPFENDYVAAICHSIDIHFSFDAAVEYLAIGKEHFTRLEEINRLLSCGFYHEFNYQDSKIEEVDDASSLSGILSLDDIMDHLEIAKENDTPNKESIPEAAEELIKGQGFYNICVSFERPFFESSGFCEYDIAYKLENTLVLGNKEDNQMLYEYHDLRYLSSLYVKKITRLNNGIDYPVLHTVIGCKEERLKQLLTPEAYELYVSELNSTK